MAKNVDTKRVVKHIPAVADAAKEGASKAIDFVREHKQGTLLLGGILIVGGSVVGTLGHISLRKQRRLDEQFGMTLQNYLDASRNGSLTLDTLNAFIDAIDAIEKTSPNKAISLNISSSQFSELVHCIFDFTLRLAEANNFDSKTIYHPHYFKEKTADDLKYYLNMQKQILEQAV